MQQMLINSNHHQLNKLAIMHLFHIFGLVIYTKAWASKAKSISLRPRPGIPTAKANKTGLKAKG